MRFTDLSVERWEVAKTCVEGKQQSCRQEVRGAVEASRKHASQHPKKDKNFTVSGGGRSPPQVAPRETSPVSHAQPSSWVILPNRKLP